MPLLLPLRSASADVIDIIEFKTTPKWSERWPGDFIRVMTE